MSFVEDCAVPLDASRRLHRRGSPTIFDKHGTRGTWYAHASVGCLHVRPVLNLKLEKDVKAMRAIAEEAFAMVREYKGSHSGEHGDGIVRSEFHEPMFGAAPRPRLRGGEGALRSGQSAQSRQDRAIAPKMDDRTLFRYPPDYRDRRVRDRRSTGRPSPARRRFSGRGRDVQQQRRLPQARGRRDVPVLSRDRATSATSRAGAPTRCGWRSPASLAPDALTSDEMADDA